jgi:hypothetical protein
MGKMNVGRVLLGGLVAGAVAFIGDGLLHGQLLQQSWQEATIALGRKVTSGDQSGMGWFALYDVMKGMAAVWIYAAIRPRYGAGPATAVRAGLAAWFLAIATALTGTIPMQYYPLRHAIIWTIAGALVMVPAALAGAALYREPPEAAPAVQPQP